MNDWLNGKTRDEEQFQDDTDKYQMMDCRILKGHQEKSLTYPIQVTHYML